MTEYEMKMQQALTCCDDAKDKIRQKDWEEALYIADGLRLLIASLEREERLHGQVS